MKIRKSERVRGGQRHVWRAAAIFGAAVLLAWCNPMVSLAEATGTVLPNSVNIRKQPDQESQVIGSSTVGKEISIRGKVDVSGITWYQVYVDSNTMGYVRADMIEKKGDGDIPTVTVAAESQTTQSLEAGDGGSQEGSSSGSPGGGAQVEAQEGMDLQYASIKVQAKVRPDPSTSNNPVDSLTPGTQVVVSGKSEGSDSKTWYFVTFTGSNGSEKTGYIRSDLLDLGEMLPSVRQLADTIGINMHTVNKAYTVLKQEGYVKVDRRRGVMVAVDIDRMRAIEEIREDLLVTLAKASCKNISGEEVHALIDEIYEEYGKGMRE